MMQTSKLCIRMFAFESNSAVNDSLTPRASNVGSYAPRCGPFATSQNFFCNSGKKCTCGERRGKKISRALCITSIELETAD